MYFLVVTLFLQISSSCPCTHRDIHLFESTSKNFHSPNICWCSYGRFSVPRHLYLWSFLFRISYTPLCNILLRNVCQLHVTLAFITLNPSCIICTSLFRFDAIKSASVYEPKLNIFTYFFTIFIDQLPLAWHWSWH